MKIITIKTSFVESGDGEEMVKIASEVPMQIIVNRGASVSSHPPRTEQYIPRSDMDIAEIEIKLHVELE